MKTLCSDGKEIARLSGRVVHVRPGLTDYELNSVKLWANKLGAVGRNHHATDESYHGERLLADLHKAEAFDFDPETAKMIFSINDLPEYHSGNLLWDLLNDTQGVQEVGSGMLTADGAKAKVMYRDQAYVIKVEPIREVQ